MSFTIDKQSIEELDLLGKYRQGSVYFLFNKVKSRGGEQLLDELFRQPLTDAGRINERTAIFRFFEQADLSFPFDPRQLVLVREYIDSGTEQGRLAGHAGMLLKKGLSVLTRDERYKRIIQGLQATIEILKKCAGLTEYLATLSGPYASRVASVRGLLQQEGVNRLLETDIYRTMSVTTIAAFDHLLKVKLKPAIQDMLHFIAEVDVNIAVGRVARENNLTYAAACVREANLLKADGLRHPCLDNAIGNELTMQEGSNVLFLTGANMAGKSTWMKAIGINVYLAHIGFPVAAKSMAFSIREGICSSINVADNIGLGYSHFYAEVVRVKQAAEATSTGKHLLLLFDELFKGTNVKDAYDGTLAVTEGFSEYTNCLFIVSTHIIEVGAALQSRPNIRFRYMPTVMDGLTPRYTYRLAEGITEDRQGMMIIRNEGILDM
ncbi:MAG: DNA mismatch repair protein [Candidatus Pseudobacter hemicellulosilyticus]|uniref:DNA mismatch repair protein n=1 Tax=Candidatus Pseudobacter hemicellulosilyticus TaxID=3121375 RepID=A0AAJ6BG96_9BACT|nr:MAG: DNA mismatch repair protein [Pseudobacter sp.]